MILLFDPENPDNPLCIHPLQIQMYIEFDLEVRQTQGWPRSPLPLGYSPFAAILNLACPETECKYHLAEYCPATHEWSKVKTPFPNGLLPTNYVDPRLDLLITLGFISKQGNVDKQTVEDAVRAWRAPSSERVQRTKQFHLRQSHTHPYARFQAVRRAYPSIREEIALAGPGPSTTIQRDRQVTARPLKSPSHPLLPSAVTAKGLVIKSLDPKGKGKACEDDPNDEVMGMEIDDAGPRQHDNIDAEGELEDFPNESGASASK